MKISSISYPPNQCDSDMLIIGHFSNETENSHIKSLGKKIEKQFTQRLENKDFKGGLNETLTLYQENGQRIDIIGLGTEDKITPSMLYSATQKAAIKAAQSRCHSVTSYLTAKNYKSINPELKHKLACLAFSYGEYRYEDTKKYSKNNVHQIKKLELFTEQDHKEHVRQASSIAEGINTSRHLANSPPNICNPQYLHKYAEKLTKKYSNCSIEVLEESTMKKMGMNALLAVGQGSANASKLIVLKYNGTNKSKKPIALVGKGITFDSGGISLKPGLNMDEMKYDMGGAASVIGTFHAVAKLKLKINLVVFVAAVENMPDGNAYRPGDVIKSYSGQTIEVLNTDAEGRMILCDTLTYAREFKPEVILDLATLTGACVIALGHHASGVMTKHQSLADEIIQAGNQIHDRAWQLPLWDDYQKQLDTTFADMKNIGGFPAGTITAGCFLSRFTEGQKWAHIDIAGTAWNNKKEGGTGRPVALLTQYLINQTIK